MKTLPFVKMQGAGNDYIYVNAIANQVKDPVELAIRVSDRHFGVGGDGLILVLPSQIADFKMRIFNADGSEAEMCGNGIRCFARYVHDEKLITGTTIQVETLAGIKTINLKVAGGRVQGATVDMGVPVFEKSMIPMLGDETVAINEALHLEGGVTFDVTAVSMGNPHAVVFVEDVESFPVEKYGPMIENHPFFPKRTNVEFVQIISEKEVRQRTWERGSGETLACGTGASAVTAAGLKTGRTAAELLVHLRGGDLEMRIDAGNGHVYMTGGAEEVFRGEWPLR